jgi:hypothetical protein
MIIGRCVSGLVKKFFFIFDNFFVKQFFVSFEQSYRFGAVWTILNAENPPARLHWRGP